MDEVKIPTREEHHRFIRRMWKTCIIMACLIFIGTGGIVLSLFMTGYDSKGIVTVSTAVFQILVLAYSVGFFIPAFLTSLVRMNIGIDMSRKGLEIGEKTAAHIDKLQSELTHLMIDMKDAIAEGKVLMKEIPKKLDEISKKAEQRGVDDIINKI